MIINAQDCFKKLSDTTSAPIGLVKSNFKNIQIQTDPIS